MFGIIQKHRSFSARKRRRRMGQQPPSNETEKVCEPEQTLMRKIPCLALFKSTAPFPRGKEEGGWATTAM
jgi:hypothetical protein